MSLKPKPQSFRDAQILSEFFEQVVLRATKEGDLTRSYPNDPAVPYGIVPIEFNFGPLVTTLRLFQQEDGYHIIVRTGSVFYGSCDNAQKTSISIADANCIDKVVELVDQARYGMWIPTEQE